MRPNEVTAVRLWIRASNAHTAQEAAEAVRVELAEIGYELRVLDPPPALPRGEGTRRSARPWARYRLKATRERLAASGGGIPNKEKPRGDRGLSKRSWRNW